MQLLRVWRCVVLCGYCLSRCICVSVYRVCAHYVHAYYVRACYVCAYYVCLRVQENRLFLHFPMLYDEWQRRALGRTLPKICLPRGKCLKAEASVWHPFFVEQYIRVRTKVKLSAHISQTSESIIAHTKWVQRQRSDEAEFLSAPCREAPESWLSSCDRDWKLDNIDSDMDEEVSKSFFFSSQSNNAIKSSHIFFAFEMWSNWIRAWICEPLPGQDCLTLFILQVVSVASQLLFLSFHILRLHVIWHQVEDYNVATLSEM